MKYSHSEASKAPLAEQCMQRCVLFLNCEAQGYNTSSQLFAILRTSCGTVMVNDAALVCHSARFAEHISNSHHENIFEVSEQRLLFAAQLCTCAHLAQLVYLFIHTAGCRKHVRDMIREERTVPQARRHQPPKHLIPALVFHILCFLQTLGLAIQGKTMLWHAGAYAQSTFKSLEELRNWHEDTNQYCRRYLSSTKAFRAFNCAKERVNMLRGSKIMGV